MIALLCAVDFEYENAKKYFNIYKIKKIDEFEIAECEFNIIIVLCGMGKKNASECAKKILSTYINIKLVISAGTAGSIGVAEIGDIVISTEVVNYCNETNCAETITQGDYNLIKKLITYSYELKDYFYKRQKIHIHTGKVLCSDELIQNKDISNHLNKKYHAQCVEMESSGVMSVCLEYKIPFVSIKIISDHADQFAFIYLCRGEERLTNLLGTVLSDLLCSITMNID